MSRNLIFLLVVSGLFSSQSIESTSDSQLFEETLSKHLYVEIYGGKYLTFGHTIHPGTRTQLPSSVWQFGGRIAYQFARHIVLSFRGNHSHAKNLTGIYNPLYPPPSLSLVNATILCSYENRLMRSIVYLLGLGMDISYCRLLQSGETFNTSYLSPTISGSLQLNIASPLYLRVQAESKLHHLLKIGSENIYLREILPNLGLGIGFFLDM